MSKIVLKAGKERSLYRLHPWVFSGAIAKIKGDVQEGDVVQVYNSDDEYLATGHYQIGSIAVRVLTFKEEEIDYNFWVERIRQAYLTRVAIGLATNPNNNVYRLVHGEGDDLSGLVIDYYAGVAVVQFHSVGMYKAREEITKALLEVMGDKLIAIYDKSEGTLPFKAGLNPKNDYLYGHTDNFTAIENGLKFNVDWLEGQKTGFLSINGRIDVCSNNTPTTRMFSICSVTRVGFHSTPCEVGPNSCIRWMPRPEPSS